MTSSVSLDGGAYADAAPQLLDSLFYAVSHDLRSPLLTVSLSAQLLEHTLKDVQVDGADEALGGLRAACDDLERMLAAMNALSRASRRASEAIELDLATVHAGAPGATIVLDELTAAELQAVLPATVATSIEGTTASIRWAADGLDQSPLVALTGSLQAYAGGPVEALACLEIAIERHRGSLEVTDGEIVLRLPVTGARS